MIVIIIKFECTISTTSNPPQMIFEEWRDKSRKKFPPSGPDPGIIVLPTITSIWIKRFTLISASSKPWSIRRKTRSSRSHLKSMKSSRGKINSKLTTTKSRLHQEIEVNRVTLQPKTRILNRVKCSINTRMSCKIYLGRSRSSFLRNKIK